MTDPVGVEPREWRVDASAVERFRQRMLEKLRMNAHKGHWDDVSIMWLLDRLGGEFVELGSAVGSGDPEAIANECADVANFAMMIADKVTR